MIRRVLWLAPIVLFACYAFLGVQPGDYRSGYDRAMRDIQQAHDKLQWMSNVGGELVDKIDYLPTSPDHSNYWNEGYRQALKDQFQNTKLR